MLTSPTRPAPWRRIVRIAAFSALSLSGTHHAGAAGQALFAQSEIYLTTDPQPVSILVQDVGAMRGFELSLAYDGEVVTVTAVGNGSLISAVRPEAQLTVVAAEPGALTVRLALEEAVDATPATDGSAAAPALLPQGSGELVKLTLAPLKQTDEPIALTVTDLRIFGAADAGDETFSCPPAQITVAQDPSDAQRAAFLEQATALRPTGSLKGLLTGSWLPGIPDGPSPNLAWMGLALLGLAVAGLAWALGRRPPSSPTGDG